LGGELWRGLRRPVQTVGGTRRKKKKNEEEKEEEEVLGGAGAMGTQGPKFPSGFRRAGTPKFFNFYFL